MADRYDFPMAYRGVTFNEHRTTAGALDITKESDTIRVNLLDFGRMQQRDQREPLHVLPGGDLGDATFAFRYVSIAGMVKGSTGAKLSDREGAVLTAFHVEEAQRDSPSTEGVTAFTYYDVTEVTGLPGAQDLGGGIYAVKEQLLGRPAGYPVITGRRSGGDSAPFAAELVCPDTRRYIDTQSTVTLNSGNGFSAACPNWNSSLGVATSPLVTINMTGAGASNFTFDITNDSASALVLSLTGTVNTDAITIDTATGIIRKNGVLAASLRTSALLSLYAYIAGGGGTASATNTTNVGSVVLTYRQARA